MKRPNVKRIIRHFFIAITWVIVGAIGFFIYTNPEIFAEKTNKT